MLFASAQTTSKLDEYVGFGLDLIQEMTDHGATHKSFDSFVICYNLTQEHASSRTGQVILQTLQQNTFRNAWFSCIAFNKSLVLGCPPSDLLEFTKREAGGNGKFECFLENINGALSAEFTNRWVKHGEEACAVTEKTKRAI